MEWITLEQGEVREFGSEGINMTEAARVDGGDEFRAHVAWVAPRGVLGRHPTRLWQLFYVLTGSGWVCGDDGERRAISAGKAVMWAPGEVHESGSDVGMVVLISQASVRLPHGI